MARTSPGSSHLPSTEQSALADMSTSGVPKMLLRGAGLLRVVLAGVVAALVSRGWPLPEAAGAYLAAGLALVFGVLLIAGRPDTLARERAAHVVLDSLLVGLLVASTGGGDSPFYPVYLMAALGIAWIDTRAKVAVAAAAVVGGYMAAVVAAGTLGSPLVTLKAGLLALFCAVGGLIALEIDALGRRTAAISSDLAAERDRAEKAEALFARSAPVLKALNVEEILQWTAEAAHAVGGGSYAHVAALSGNLHRTLMEGDTEACPSWWHPSIQRLVLWSCRERDVVRSEETIHGIENLLAVPIGPAEGDKWGAMVLGGAHFGGREERSLKLLAEWIAPTLESAGEAPGGVDPLSGLPNRMSLRRVLQRELAYGRTLTVLVVSLDGLQGYNGAYGHAAADDVLRRIGAKLKDVQQRAFRYGDTEFVLILGGVGENRVRRTALAVQQLVAKEADAPGRAHPSVTVGFTFAEAGKEDVDQVLNAALRAVERARGRVEKVAGFPTGADTRTPEPPPEDERRVTEVVGSLVEALEVRDPHIGEHLRTVSRISLRLGRQLALPQEQLDALVTGALLHDLGKIGISDRILHKPGALTGEEYELIKRHPVLGARIIAPVRELAPVLPVVRHHHERYDGRGYPDGLRGEDIPLIARVVSVADAFDSMMHNHLYGRGLSQEAALAEIQANSGTQFDPRVVRALLKVVEELGDRRLGSTG